MATQTSEDPLWDVEGRPAPCVRCQVPTTGTMFASANVYLGVDASGQRITQWLKPIPVCERHRHDLVRNMSVLSWCTTDEVWGLRGRPCTTCGRLLTITYRRS
jgi:hypothetical protein